MAHRILSLNTLGMILAGLSWAAIAWIVYAFLRMIANGSGWIYLD